jgi:hypothetical protein
MNELKNNVPGFSALVSQIFDLALLLFYWLGFMCEMRKWKEYTLLIVIPLDYR